VAAKARDQISNAFEGWAKAEKDRSFFGTEGAVLDAATTTPSTATTDSAGGGGSAVHLHLAFWAWFW
jgi:hypothetical protein